MKIFFFFSKKLAFPGLFLRTIFTTIKCEKMSIQYMVMGFERHDLSQAQHQLFDLFN